jgi:hypothetical protein
VVPSEDLTCWWWQEISAYKELLELLPAKGVYLSAVLPDESGPAVALPGVCRLTRAEGHGGAQTKPLLFIGTCRGDQPLCVHHDASIREEMDGPYTQ